MNTIGGLPSMFPRRTRRSLKAFCRAAIKTGKALLLPASLSNRPGAPLFPSAPGHF
jgi:hypothetical protein